MLHTQLYEPPLSASYAPAVFVQAARELQTCVPAVHSSMSVQLTPLPVYPGGQAHVNEPAVSVQ